MPDMSCWCLRFFYLSLTMNEIMVAGIRAKPIDTTKEVKIPPAVAALCLSFSVTG